MKCICNNENYLFLNPPNGVDLLYLGLLEGPRQKSAFFVWSGKGGGAQARCVRKFLPKRFIHPGLDLGGRDGGPNDDCISSLLVVVKLFVLGSLL